MYRREGRGLVTGCFCFSGKSCHFMSVLCRLCTISQGMITFSGTSLQSLVLITGEGGARLGVSQLH